MANLPHSKEGQRREDYGVGEEDALRVCRNGVGRSPGELATQLLTCASAEGQDDATVITVRMEPYASLTE